VREGVVDADRVERLIAAAREVDDVLALRQAIAVGATMMSKLGRHDRAKELGRECADLAQREPSLAAFRGIHIGDLALIHYVDGDVANAERCLRQAIEVTTEVGDTANIAVNRCNLAELLLDQHKPEDAITHLRAVLQAPQSPPITSAIALALLVEAEYVSGDIPAAQAIADEAESELARLAVLDTSLTAQLDRLRRTTGALLANSAAETSTE
jgi:tetratricopeptide (TPR) repeat protein